MLVERRRIDRLVVARGPRRLPLQNHSPAGHLRRLTGYPLVSCPVLSSLLFTFFFYNYGFTRRKEPVGISIRYFRAELLCRVRANSIDVLILVMNPHC